MLKEFKKYLDNNIKLDIDKYYPTISADKFRKLLTILMIGDEKTISFNGIEVNIVKNKNKDIK